MTNSMFGYDLGPFFQRSRVTVIIFVSKCSLRTLLFHSIMIINVRQGEIKMSLHFASGQPNVLYFVILSRMKMAAGGHSFCGKKIKSSIKK